MFTFDNTTIIASVVLILVAVLTSLFNPFFRRVGIVAYGLPSSTNESDDTSTEEEPEEEGKETIAELDDKAEEHPSLPPISIIFTPTTMHRSLQETSHSI